MIEIKHLDNPNILLKNVENGKYTTNDVKIAYRDEIDIRMKRNHFNKAKELESNFNEFVRINNKLCEKYEIAEW